MKLNAAETIKQLRANARTLASSANLAIETGSELQKQLSQMIELNDMLMQKCDLSNAALDSSDIYRINQHPIQARQALESSKRVLG